jgi:hypothetical protein
MAEIPKHEQTKRRKPRSESPKPAKPPYASVDVESAIDRLASIVSTYVSNARDNEHNQTVLLASGENYLPVRLDIQHLEDIADALTTQVYEQNASLIAAAERIATAFERIATAMESKQAS